MNRESRQQIWKDVSGEVKEKEAELAGTYDMPNSKPTKVMDGNKAVIKTASYQDQDELDLRSAFGVSSFQDWPPSQADDIKTAGAMRPHVDISGLDAQVRVVEKVATRFALPDERLYPLDDYGQVKMASDYFEEHHRQFPPELRREYCRNMVKRANELDIPMTDVAENYAADSYASPAQVKIALDMRRTALLDNEHLDVLDKLASAAHVVEPEAFAAVLQQFDKMAGIEHLYDSEVLDPYLSTFSKLGAKAQVSTADEDEVLTESNEHTPLRILVELAQRKQNVVTERFGADFAEEFAKSPKALYNSMPRDERLVLLRMANSSVGSHRNAST